MAVTPSSSFMEEAIMTSATSLGSANEAGAIENRRASIATVDDVYGRLGIVSRNEKFALDNPVLYGGGTAISGDFSRRMSSSGDMRASMGGRGGASSSGGGTNGLDFSAAVPDMIKTMQFEHTVVDTDAFLQRRNTRTAGGVSQRRASVVSASRRMSVTRSEPILEMPKSESLSVAGVDRSGAPSSNDIADASTHSPTILSSKSVPAMSGLTSPPPPSTIDATVVVVVSSPPSSPEEKKPNGNDEDRAVVLNRLTDFLAKHPSPHNILPNPNYSTRRQSLVAVFVAKGGGAQPTPMPARPPRAHAETLLARYSPSDLARSLLRLYGPKAEEMAKELSRMSEANLLHNIESLLGDTQFKSTVDQIVRTQKGLTKMATTAGGSTAVYY